MNANELIGNIQIMINKPQASDSRKTSKSKEELFSKIADFDQEGLFTLEMKAAEETVQKKKGSVSNYRHLGGTAMYVYIAGPPECL